MRTSRGFSMIEVVVAALILGGLTIAALEAAGQAAAGRISASDRAFAETLALRLLSDVDQLAYEEPSAAAGSTSPGPDAGEANRDSFDDIDDYHQFDDKEPTDVDGNLIAGATGWRWDVQVERVMATNPNVSSTTESGLKRIRVSVRHGDRPEWELVAWRSKHGMGARP
jgi:prepilin-type N-terminal cleavage/methylation domain-containing protein